MNEEIREKVIKLREIGKSYANISKSLNIPLGTVKSICSRARTKVVDIPEVNCKNCGVPIVQSDFGRKKKFCNSICRMDWWNKNNHRVERRAYYKQKCLYCGREFERYGRPNAKYCSRACYIGGRYYADQ